MSSQPGSAGMPTTPIPPSPSFPYSSSPGTSPIATPTDSMRRYSSALKAFTKKGLSSAMEDAKDETRQSERQFDSEFGYFDEDPIERHVKLYLTPKKGEAKEAGSNSLLTQRLANNNRRENQKDMEDVEMLTEYISKDEENQQPEEEIPRPMFRPGLIHFHRSSKYSTSSGFTSVDGSATPSLNRSETTLGSSMSSEQSTPFGYDQDSRMDSFVHTPGSTWSEASFEAVKSDDWQALYGNSSRPGPSRATSHSRPVAYRQPSWTSKDRNPADSTYRNSFGSTTSTITASTPESTSSGGSIPSGLKRPSLLRPRPRAAPYPAAPELLQYAEDPHMRLYGLTEEEWTDTTKKHKPQLGPRQPSGEVRNLARFAALGLTASRHQDEEGFPGFSDSFPMSDGRSISEDMIFQAGISSQRGRDSLRGSI